MIIPTDTAGAWRSEPGSYLLLLDLAAPVSPVIGRLGSRALPQGRYAYFGSALGPGGVAARLNRHLRVEDSRPGRRPPAWRVHWHIDYLTSLVPVVGAAVVYGSDRRECEWSLALQALPGAVAPVPGFGSSDCRSGCAAHLWRLPDALPLSWIENELTQCPIQAT